MSDRNLTIAFILSATDRASAVLGRVFANAERHAKGLERVGKRFSDMGDAGLVAGGAMTAVFAKTIMDARESVIAQAKVTQGFKTMGGTAKQAQDAINLASVKQFEWGVEDEKIMDVMGKMSTFSRVITDVAAKNDVFNRATQAAFDMQAKGFGEAMGNITQLGKALQNPALGAQALAKAGAINREDMPIIKRIQAMQGLGAAQVYVMKAIEKQVKGTAAATVDPLKQMEIGYGEVSEAIGGALLPEVNKLAGQLNVYVPKIIAFANAHGPTIVMVAKAAVGLLAFSASMKVVGFAFSGVATGFRVFGGAVQVTKGLLGFGRVALQAGENLGRLQMIGLKVGSFMRGLGPLFKIAGTAVIKFGATLLASPITWYVLAAVALGTAVYFIIKNWDQISAFFARLWAGLKAAFSRFVDWAKFLFLNFTPYGLIIKHWAPISGMFKRIWQGVKDVFSGAWKWFVNLNVKFGQAGTNIVMSIWRGMKLVITKPIELMAEMTKKMRDYLPFSPAKVGPLKDIHKIKLVETIAQSMNAKPMLGAMRNITGQLYDQIPQSLPSMPGHAGNSTQITFSPTINLSGGATEGDARMITAVLKTDFEKLMRNYEQQKSRTSFNS